MKKSNKDVYFYSDFRFTSSYAIFEYTNVEHQVQIISTYC